MARSLNCVHLIGNLTRDPELRSTASGRPVCDIGLATNRSWTTESGEKKEETVFHRIVLWGKLAEIASQYLKKGHRAYFQGRISTRPWTAQDGTQKYSTEIIAEDMMMLTSDPSVREKPRETPPPPTSQPRTESESPHPKPGQSESVEPDEIPF
jgi:single-strand DNA-binding protein